MDTSDSEYFESADEDVLEDEDINHKNNITKDSKETGISERINKLNVSKEIIDKHTIKPSINNSEESAIISGIPKESSTANEKLSNSSPQSDSLDRNLEDNIADEKSLVGVQSIDSNHEHEIPQISQVTEKMEVEETHANSSEKNKKPSQEHTNDEEDNLWAEDELDWETETKLDEKDDQRNKSKTIEQTSQPEVSTITSIKPTKDEKTQNVSDSWGGWGSWGASVLSSATQGVSSITTQLTNAIESGLGVVDPEELAKINSEEEKMEEDMYSTKKYYQKYSTNSNAGFGIGNLVKLVENTGTKVISGGLDTLETIGKKTMEVLQEGDPGLKKKRAFLKIDQDKPVLSQILREAKEKSEKEDVVERKFTKKTKTYETLFDDHHGLVHLEALELLSKQCEMKLKNVQNSLTGEEYTKFMNSIEMIKSLCELPDEMEEEPDGLEDVDAVVKMCTNEMGCPQISYDKVIEFSKETENWLDGLDVETCDENELHQKAIETLAQITAMAVERYHKIGELLLVKSKNERDTTDESTRSQILTTFLTTLIGMLAEKFSEKLNMKNTNNENKAVSELITNVFFEAANSSSYIQDAYILLIPVIQVGEV